MEEAAALVAPALTGLAKFLEELLTARSLSQEQLDRVRELRQGRIDSALASTERLAERQGGAG